jgi:hypothetical protein
MKKRLCHDWPNCKLQNDELSERITDLVDEYHDEIKKKQENNLAADALIDNLKNKNLNLTNDFEMKQVSHNNLNTNHNHNKSNMKVAFSEKNFDEISINKKGKIKTYRTYSYKFIFFY